jgi:hypothetical protein
MQPAEFRIRDGRLEGRQEIVDRIPVDMNTIIGKDVGNDGEIPGVFQTVRITLEVILFAEDGSHNFFPAYGECD